MTENPECAPDTLYARIEALEKRVEALEKKVGVGFECLFETHPDPYAPTFGRMFCRVHRSYECARK